MPAYPKIKLIPNTGKEDEITVREEDLMSINWGKLLGAEDPVYTGDEDKNILADLRLQGELAGKALFLNVRIAEPKIVIDSEGLTCLIFIKKRR